MTNELCAHFLPGGRVLFGHEDGQAAHEHGLSEPGISVDEHRTLPDAIVCLAERNWLVLLQDASSRGPIDEDRRDQLRSLFSNAGFSNAGAQLVYVSCFGARGELRGYPTDFAWGSSVWCADAPDHLIHFNGERLVGPREASPAAQR